METPARSITKTLLIRSCAICEFSVEEKKSQIESFRNPTLRLMMMEITAKINKIIVRLLKLRLIETENYTVSFTSTASFTLLSCVVSELSDEDAFTPKEEIFLFSSSSVIIPTVSSTLSPFLIIV